MNWRLYIDESGNFADSTDDAVVGGMLLLEDADRRLGRRLQAALDALDPHLPRPMHAAHFFSPALHALSWMRAGSGRRVGGGVSGIDSRLVAIAAKHLAALEPALVSRLAAGGGGWPPGIPILHRLDDGLRRADPSVHEALLQHVVALRAQFAALIRNATSPQPEGDRRSPSAWVYAAGEHQRSEALPLAGERREGRRYLEILHALLERVALVLVRSGRHHAVDLFVLSRGMGRDAQGRTSYLRPSDLHEILCELREDFPDVAFSVREIRRYTSAIDAVYVLADFVANRSRLILRSLGRTLGQAEDQFEHEIGARPRSGAPPGSHLSATGDPRRALANRGFARGGRTRILQGVPGRRWAVEQAAEWVEILR